MNNKPEKKVAASDSNTQEGHIVLAPMTVSDFAQLIDKPASEVILTLLKQGTMSTRNQLLSENIVAQLAKHYELDVVEKPKKSDSQAQVQFDKSVKVDNASSANWQTRMPVVVVIGHVDHGKTTFLDYIRKTRVAAKEKGGITQHLGAYEVSTSQGSIVFLDTPGHEAFSLMRVRGIKIADIAVLMIAADDGIMPQTIEAMNHAKLVGLPIIVAMNKIDKATPAQLETLKRQLAQHDLVPEEWGGSTVCMAISAKLGTGVEELLDVIALQAELLELKANLSVPAQGYVLESKLEKGRGPVATVICQHGILKVGDYFIAGAYSGKVSSLINTYGKAIKEVGPSVPVLVAGFSQLPHAGESFEVVTQEVAKKRVSGQEQAHRIDIKSHKSADNKNIINLIVKTDNASSKEALIGSIEKLSAKANKQFYIIHAGVGDISESDITLAQDTGAIIYTLHVKMQPNAHSLASQTKVEIKHFDIIYKLLEDLEALAEAGKPVKMVTKKIGEAFVLKVFDIKNLGIVAGAQVKTGRFVRDGKVIIWRGKHKVGEGTIKGLQRDRKAVKEVHAGFECAFLVDGFDTWEVDDRVECFQDVPA